MGQADRRAAVVGRRRRTLRVGCLLLLALAGLFLLALFHVGSGPLPVVQRSPAPANAVTLRVVCFNVLHGWPDFPDQEARSRRMRDALRDLRPDLLILQEAWRTRRHGSLVERLGRDLELHSTYARANGRLWLIGFEEGSALLSRHPILAAERMVLAPRRPLWENRIALIVTLAVGDERIVVAATHLGAGGRQATDLARRLGRAPLVIAGDFNAAAGSDALRRFDGWTNALPGGIDHVLVAPGRGWRIVRARRVLDGADPPLSDHPGLLVVLGRQ